MKPHLATVEETPDRFYRARCSCSWRSGTRRAVWSRAHADALEHIGQQQFPAEEQQTLF